MTDLFPSGSPLRASADRPLLKRDMVAPAPCSPAYLTCSCGAPAVFGFGLSPLKGKPGLRVCGRCANSDGREQ